MEPVTSSYIYSRSTLVEVLDDLCVKFILNLPEEELQSIERLSFQIEAAQWFYEDFIREINPSLPTLNLRSFLSKIFAVCPLPLIAGLPPNGAESAFLHFMAYKTRVPVRGAIILNPTMDKCLLVKGWKKGASWSFPRGKINKDEDDLVCAIREVREETGFDCERFARKEDFVDMTMRDQNLKLFIVPGIPEDTVFECQTRKEISDIKWHKLTDLPTFNKQKKQQNPPQNEVRIGKYYMVTPFLKDLRKWISTTGKKWLQDQHQQKLSTAANLIAAEETEVEEELFSSPPATDVSLAGSRSTQPANGFSDQDEASMRLKNMLQFGPQKEPDQSSAKLMNMLGGGVSVGGNSEHPQVAQLGPNPRALLSMLRTGDGSGALNHAPEANKIASPQTPKRAPPAAPQHQASYAQSPPPKQQSPKPPPQITQQKKAPKPLKNTGGIGAGAGWPQFPRNVPEELPSPPPTSNFAAPPQMSQFNNHTTPKNPPPPQQQPTFPAHQNGSNPPQRYPQQTPQPPLTPLDAFTPSKPPDPNQAGTLLSILKGATPKPSTPTPTLAKPPTPKGPRSQQPTKPDLLATLRSSPRALQSPYAPPPPITPNRPATTQPHFRTQYSAKAPAFDRRESISNEQQQTLLAMFRTGTPVPEDVLMSSPEQSPVRPVRMRSVSGGSRRSGRRAEVQKSPLGKEREGLMAYLEGVAKMGGQ